MTSQRRLLIIIIPFSILVCYATIRFLNLSTYDALYSATKPMHVDEMEHVTHSQEIWDQKTLTSEIYEKGFRNDIQNDICPNLGEGLNLLVMIMTKSHHLTKRLAVRKTWGHYALMKNISIAFLMGSGKNNAIKSELNMYSDIIIEKNIDSDFNKSLKSISMMEFVSTYCPKVNYVLKTKDDIFINMPSLLKVIENLKINDTNFYGHIYRHRRTVRDKKSKYYISQNQYEGSVLPDYLGSQAYLFPGHLTKEVYEESLNQTYVPVEEVFLTGIVPEKLGIQRNHKVEFITKHYFSEYKSHVGTISIKAETPSMQYTYWEKINNPTYVKNTEIIVE